MDIYLQPILENDKVKLIPLSEDDFEELYRVASDPNIWSQHPNKNRYKRDEFKNFFQGAIKSNGAFKILDKSTNNVIGSTRFYDYLPEEKSILIGYTFFGIDFWGKGYNHAVKNLMLDYIFKYVQKVILHIGAENYRSQKSILKLGANKVDEQVITYFGESPKLNFVYEINRDDWLKRHPVD